MANSPIIILVRIKNAKEIQTASFEVVRNRLNEYIAAKKEIRPIHCKMMD